MDEMGRTTSDRFDTSKTKKTKPVLNYSTDPIYEHRKHPLITDLPKKTYDDETRLQLMGYLRNANFMRAGVCFGFLTDIFTGEKMPATGCLLSDGEWNWSDDLWLYIRDHDIAVPEEFVQHVKDFYANGGRCPVVPYMGKDIPGYLDGDGEDQFSRRKPKQPTE